MPIWAQPWLTREQASKVKWLYAVGVGLVLVGVSSLFASLAFRTTAVTLVLAIVSAVTLVGGGAGLVLSAASYALGIREGQTQ